MRAGRALAAAAAILALAPAAAAACPRERVPAPPPAPASAAAVAAYLAAVDAASARVRTGSLGTSVQGRELPYALVGAPRAIAPGRLARTSARLRALRDGRERVALGGLPAVTWLIAGVHANERSGVDADLRVLRDLAAGRRCAVLRRSIVVIVPMQNPDGLVAGTRTNAAGFDLNRDWFAATQPETAGKLALLGKLPPLALADQHEQEGESFFFPPYADPVHHEVPDAALRAMDGVAAPALARAFRRARRPFAPSDSFDLFFMGYADTVASTLFGAAGMTFEKGGAAPYREKVADHALAARALVTAIARRRDALLRRWAHGWRRARAEGRRGVLQPNAVLQRHHRVRFDVPRRPVHAYLLRADVHGADAAALVARLRAAGVRVDRLARDVALPAFRAYGSARPARATLPAGTWVVDLGQTRKHWIQAMLGQDAHVPFPYFYDVSSWSNPLLMGLDGGWSERPLPRGAVVRGAGTTTGAVPGGETPAVAFDGDSVGALALAADLLARGASVRREPGGGTLHASGVARAELAPLAAARRVTVRAAAGAPATAVGLRSPRVALLADLQPRVTGLAGHEDSRLHESHGWTRFVLEQRLGMAVDVLDARQLAAGALVDGGYTALVVADGRIPPGALDAAALEAIQAFVAGGGTFVGVRALGLDVARAARVTAVRTRAVGPTFRVPGATFAVSVDDRSPLGWGAGGRGFQLNAGDPVLEPGTGTSVVTYPRRRGFVSGHVSGTAPLRGTPALVEEAFGAGRVALFASDPSFRGYVEGGQRLLANALLAPPRAAGRRAAGTPRAVTTPDRPLGLRRPARSRPG